ncbi:hypothetical protein PVAP13_2KG331567 [Panicum virgatum]|uniref:Uncharacterized protein n=1 Tax=Panicum virgatum TaxID=38727 RepID=A0A8T0W9D7_PANVG|nr:hypothetical protein PVAP13_2KG331567 [Panicum virgatum]
MATTVALARATSMPAPLPTPVRPASCPVTAHLGGASLLLLLGHTCTHANDHGSAAAAATIPRVATSGSLVGGSAHRRPSAAPSTRGARAQSNSGCRSAEGRHVMGDGGAIDERFGGGRPPRPSPAKTTSSPSSSTPRHAELRRKHPTWTPRRWPRTLSRWPTDHLHQPGLRLAPPTAATHEHHGLHGVRGAPLLLGRKEPRRRAPEGGRRRQRQERGRGARDRRRRGAAAQERGDGEAGRSTGAQRWRAPRERSRRDGGGGGRRGSRERLSERANQRRGERGKKEVRLTCRVEIEGLQF